MKGYESVPLDHIKPRKLTNNNIGHESEQIPNSNNNADSKHLKIIIYMLLVIIAILIIVSCVLIAYIVKSYNNIEDDNIVDFRSNNTNIPVHLIEGLDNYLKQHCVLHQDTYEGEGMDKKGEGITVIRNPVDIPSPININYSPLINNITNKIEYYPNRDINGNLVAKPLCQTDFDTSTYTMKNNDYVFDTRTCEYPLPSWMNESDILNLPRRYKSITHRVTITTVEVVAELEPGHSFEFFTYNGTVPGPPLRVRVGDWIDLTLINPNTSNHEHSIDFHAMTGPGGGAVSLRVNPGEKARTIWQAIIPGMFIYHCASGWVSDHISKGMYGAIIVESKNGFPYSDMDIYLGQGELYLHYPLVNNWGTKFARPKPNLHNTFDPVKERYEISDVVMFNGAPFALVHNPIITTVGSVVRCFIVSGGPNSISSFHIIGDHFDRVWLHGDFNTSPQQNIQTTTVPPGGCAVTDWRHDSPGTFIFVDHALTRAFVKGNLGKIKACNKNDLGCISGSSDSSIGVKYTCNINRYNNTNIDTLLSNNDCIFCPWNRDKFIVNNNDSQTDEIYNYLDTKCNIRMNGYNWQGDESRMEHTVSDTINNWRKNRYPGIKQWNLGNNLQNVDSMIGNPRGISYDNQNNSYGILDDSSCVITVGSYHSITIIYSINRKGQGEITISIARNQLINGGWISFGRGGNGISAMTDSHIHTVFFNQDGNNVKFVLQFCRDYSIPVVDTSNSQFNVLNPSLLMTNHEINFNFKVISGDWIIPSSSLKYVPMIVAAGKIGDDLETTQMVKHFDKDVIHFDPTGEQCLFGGAVL